MRELNKIVKHALKNRRTKEEITATFQAAGIIDKNGKLKSPYKNIKIPV